ncbi:radical SAM protein [Methanobrevibacter sp. OttesenSCG-928-K11]|nr:radical SAM protein [Methanobrevibacter sp. OttesenSCG-928-K11]MDL2271315.1 radical SAM protein [Methanobrevibacter sp. OttesenSCG-928-I08]
MPYKEITCKSALNKLKRKMPYKYDLNIYRGCEHGCKYCYALYSHKYLNSKNYYNDIFIKTNIVEELEKQLSKPSWKKDVISIGTVSDSYQKAEKDYEIMPEILKVLIKYKNPTIISTKSDIILRDFDLITELADVAPVNIASTILTTDENIKNLIEPETSSVENRFNFLKKFKNSNASVGLHMMPVLPYLTDSYENIDSLFKKAKKNNVDYVLPGVLNLYGKTKQTYFNFLKEVDIDIYNKTKILFKKGKVDSTYTKDLYLKINEIKRKYMLSSNYMSPIQKNIKKFEGKQTTLFDY